MKIINELTSTLKCTGVHNLKVLYPLKENCWYQAVQQQPDGRYLNGTRIR